MAPKKDIKEESSENLKENLNELKKIVDWFENQEEVDVEEGLEKVRRGAALVKATKVRLGEIENEFAEIQRDIESEERD
jgi:exonuclease VII small subunit